MGQEIAYCARCGCQLRSADFEKHKAFRFELQSYCKTCAPDAVKTLSPGTMEAILKQREAPKEPSQARPPKSSQDVDHGLTPPDRHLSNREPHDQRFLAALGVSVLAGAAFLGLLLAGGGGGPEKATSKPAGLEAGERRSASSGAEETALARGSGGVRLDGPAPRVSPDPDEAALAALQAAREYGKSKPTDVPGQTALLEQALRASAGTRYAAEAAREYESFQKRQKDRMTADLSGVDDQIGTRCAEEAFGTALDVIETAWTRHLNVEWTQSLGQRVRRVNELAEKLFSSLRSQALEARRTGAEEKVQEISGRVARWKISKLSAELDAALSSAPRGSPPPTLLSKEAQSYQACWESAMSKAADRDFSGAVQLLADALAEVKDAALRLEAGGDLALFRQAGAAYTEILRALSTSARGARMNLKFLDESGSLASGEGAVLHANSHQVEISIEKRCVIVLFGEIAASSLAEILRSKPPKPGEAESPASAFFCLLEGDADAARRNLPQPSTIAEKYWTYARRAARPPPDKAAREGEARRLFYQAERESIRPETALGALETYKALESAYKDTAFVHRNGPAIAGRREIGKEYYFLASDLAAGGTFKTSTSDKVKSFWTSASDSDAGRIQENYVELAFSALANTEYRGWVYVGGCCAETLSFAFQATELVAAHPQSRQPDPAEPGSEFSVPVKQTLVTSVRTHASHGGPKQPSRWGWVPLSLPKFSSAGLKKVRLVTRQQGFSVAYALVSSSRQGSPRDVDMVDLERQRTEALRRFGTQEAARPAIVNPADLLFRGDFRSMAAAQPAWTIYEGDFPIKFDGQLDFDLSPPPGVPNGKPSELTGRAAYEVPIRVSVDVEHTRSSKGMLIGLRLHCYKGEVTKVVHADLSEGKYFLYVSKTFEGTAEVKADGPRRERWTLDLGPDGQVVWQVDGKEVLRTSREKGEDAYRVILNARATAGVEAGARVRISNLTVERLKP
jgi:hypothetical protein